MRVLFTIGLLAWVQLNISAIEIPIDRKVAARIVALQTDGTNYQYVYEDPQPNNTKKYLLIDGQKKHGPFEMVGSMARSPDGRSLAYFAKVGTQSFLYINEKQLEPIESERIFELQWSPDSRFVRFSPNGLPEYLVYDTLLGTGPFLADNWLLSPNGKMVAFSIFTRDQQFLLFNGREQLGPFDRVRQFKWSPDGSDFGYAVYSQDDEYLFTAGRKVGPFLVKWFDWLSDNRSLAILASPYEKNGYSDLGNGISFLFVGNQKIGPFLVSSGARGYPYLSADHHLAYSLVNADKTWSLQVNDQKFGPFEQLSGFSWSSNQHFAYQFTQKAKDFVVIDNQKFGPYDWVTKPEGSRGSFWSPDGMSAVFIAGSGQKGYVVTNREQFGPFERIGNIAWSPDSKQIAFDAIPFGDRELLPVTFVGGAKLYEKFTATQLLFSPTGEKVALNGISSVDQKAYVLVGTEKYGPFEAVNGMAWSPDGRAIAFVAMNNGKVNIFVGKDKWGTFDAGDLSWLPGGAGLRYEVRLKTFIKPETFILKDSRVMVGDFANGHLSYVDGNRLVIN